MTITEYLVKNKITKNKGESFLLISEGVVYINSKRVNDHFKTVSENDTVTIKDKNNE